MYNLDELQTLRFAMTEVPEVGGQPGAYEEKWAQWFLERSFFRDFVYRNPRKRPSDFLRLTTFEGRTLWYASSPGHFSNRRILSMA
jgi:hypothetical protein